MLFNTSLIAHVGSGIEGLPWLLWTNTSPSTGEGASSSQRCLRILNTKREKEIIRMNYHTTVLAVRLNRKRLVVVLENTIYIYDMSTMHLAHTIGSTPPNPSGMSVLYAWTLCLHAWPIC